MTRIHMVGIGGIGMSSIALVLLNRGYIVSGSDMAASDTTQLLTSRGATIFIGHEASNVGNADVVVYSSAVDPSTNVETKVADEKRIPLIKRAEMLGELMRMKFGIGIAGTHGKTTTTTLTGLVVSAGGFDPTIIVGGKVAEFGSNALVGEGDIIVIEADEYDRTFLRLTPSIAVVTNIEADHLDIYDDLDDVKNAFVQYTNSVPFFGTAILCIDDSNVREVIDRIDRSVVTYGSHADADIRCENIQQVGLDSTFDVVAHGTNLGTVTLRLPGQHNVLNALAAVAVGLQLQIDFADIRQALKSFTGVQRRFEVLAEADDVIVVNDYAHHPSEVAATLNAAARCWPENRIVAVFQPHLYSRTVDLKNEFGKAFTHADQVIISGIYGAREQPMAGVTGKLLSDMATQNGHKNVRFVQELAEISDLLATSTASGDRIIFMGAGDIWRTAKEFSQRVSDNKLN